MSYRQPAFYFYSAGKATDSTLSDSVPPLSGFPLSRIADDRARPMWRQGNSGANHWIKIDRGNPVTPVEVSDIIIPDGHELDGLTFNVQSAATDSFPGAFLGGANILDGTFVVPLTGGTVGDREARWLQLNFVDAGDWAAGELFVTEKREIGIGVNPRYVNQDEPNYSETRMVSGESYRIVNGQQVRVITIRWEGMSGADKQVIDDLLAATRGGVDSFWFQSPDDADPLLNVKLTEPASVVQDSPNPVGTGPTYQITLNMIEAIE